MFCFCDFTKTLGGDVLHLWNLGICDNIDTTINASLLEGNSRTDADMQIIPALSENLKKIPPIHMWDQKTKTFETPLFKCKRVEGKHRTQYLHQLFFALEIKPTIIKVDTIRGLVFELLHLYRLVDCLVYSRVVDDFIINCFIVHSRKLYRKYNELRRALRLGIAKTSKWHIFLNHYVEIMRNHGPLYLMSTAQFEAMHCKFVKRPYKNTNRHDDSLKQMVNRGRVDSMLDLIGYHKSVNTEKENCSPEKIKFSEGISFPDLVNSISNEHLDNEDLDNLENMLYHDGPFLLNKKLRVNMMEDICRNGGRSFVIRVSDYVELCSNSNELRIVQILQLFSCASGVFAIVKEFEVLENLYYGTPVISNHSSAVFVLDVEIFNQVLCLTKCSTENSVKFVRNKFGIEYNDRKSTRFFDVHP
eukprot:TRINITY_DN256734_c0_g1_i6.p1 TRINITY_DN256734_c0_g1~~TRINITY_DN256734_c0_g1_i6.p1  ORF type:complete len:439 (+),score=76.43 TRINITY_DN256734_c0_g1_i6:69-1319(+)